MTTTTMLPPSAFASIGQWPDFGKQLFAAKQQFEMFAITQAVRKYPGIRGTDDAGDYWWVRIGHCRNPRQMRYDAYAIDATALNNLATAPQAVEHVEDDATRRNCSALMIPVAFLFFDLLAEEVRQSPDSPVCTLDADAIFAIIACDERTQGNEGLQLLTSALDVLARLQIRKISISQQATRVADAVAKPLLRYRVLPLRTLKVTLDPWCHAFLSPRIP